MARAALPGARPLDQEPLDDAVLQGVKGHDYQPAAGLQQPLRGSEAAGQLAKAEGKYKAALAENPRSHAAAAGLGRIAFNKAAYSDAASYYGRAVKASGSNGEYRIHYGDALFKLGKYADAAGAAVTYRESPMPHAIDPRFAAELAPWIANVLRSPAPELR